MIHLFQHTFVDQQAITLVVDMDSTPVSMFAHPEGLVNSHRKEYKVWLHEVIVPALLELATTPQVDAFTSVGNKVLSRVHPDPSKPALS